MFDLANIGFITSLVKIQITCDNFILIVGNDNACKINLYLKQWNIS